MLSGVLKSDVAVQVSIRLMNTFVAMRRTLASIAPLLTRIETAERSQIMDHAKNDANQVRNEERFKLILDAMQDKKFPSQKIFFDGQFYDAFVWLKKYIRMARKELIVLDPYFAASVLPQIAQKRDGVSVVIVQCKRGRKLLPDVDVQMFNAQYKNSLSVKESERFHDRYFIIDRKTLVHIGASLNYFGLMNKEAYAKKAELKRQMAKAAGIDLVEILPNTNWESLLGQIVGKVRAG